jgi:hypothetical protein
MEKNLSPYLKNRAKKDLGIVQVVEHLPSNSETLSSNPITARRKRTQISVIQNKTNYSDNTHPSFTHSKHTIHSRN